MGFLCLVELSLPLKSASWLIIIFLLVKKLAMKLEIFPCTATVCFWAQMCFCRTSSPVVGFQHANWAVFKNLCHSSALLVAIGFPSSWNMVIPSQGWVTSPPNESSTGDDQSHSAFCVVGDHALWLITIVGYHWSPGSKLITKIYRHHSSVVVSSPLKIWKSFGMILSNKWKVTKDIFQSPQTCQVLCVTGINHVPTIDWGTQFRAIQCGTVRPTGRGNSSAAWSGTPGEVLGGALGCFCTSAGVSEYETVSI